MAFGPSDNGDNSRPGLLSDINVTPMVDVMLVLLIIFMVAAPMMTQGLDVDLPKVDAKAMRTDQDLVVLTIKADGQILLDETPLASVDNLDAQVKAVLRAKRTESLFLKADRTVPYGQVAAVMGALREAGVTNVGLVTEPSDRSRSPQ
ncbi:MAG: protein TolR [Deltaproteobacteria bacterium]|jgi:biopolymer transport protein TolR|nr:protein TolR [Deltaproteobacteria bacterium]